MNWGSDDEGDHPTHDADFEKKRTESQALLLEFQRQRAADTVVDKGTKRQQQANIGEVVLTFLQCLNSNLIYHHFQILTQEDGHSLLVPMARSAVSVHYNNWILENVVVPVCWMWTDVLLFSCSSYDNRCFETSGFVSERFKYAEIKLIINR
jgi:hypothetical protein